MKWIRNNLKDLKKYKVDNYPYKIKLDANEGENYLIKDLNKVDMDLLENINMYPDNSSQLLREKIGNYVGAKPEHIIPGNGSSELIELIMKTFIDKGDKILSFVPTFSMYRIFSKIYQGEFVGIEGQGNIDNRKNKRDDFSVDMDILISKAKEINPKLILLCNPNNPTGHLISRDEVIKLLENVDSLVVVDEAYIEFSQGSLVGEVENYHNLIVLRTFSKALGLAGIRLGYMVSSMEIINILNKVRAPYNLNSMTQAFGIMALENKEEIASHIENVKVQRENLYKDLKEIGLKAYESHGNFILFYLESEDLMEELKKREIIIRNFSGDLENYYRVTIGSSDENKEFIENLKEILENEKS